MAALRTLRDIVEAWAEAVRALGLEVKGLWLVDFDNGEGYYCWKYPEDTRSPTITATTRGSPGGFRFSDAGGQERPAVSS